MREDLLSLASDIVDQARKLGADEVDAYVTSSAETSARVRMSEVERIIDATSHAASVRVIKEKRTAVCSTVDLTPKAISAMVAQALELAEIAEEMLGVARGSRSVGQGLFEAVLDRPERDFQLNRPSSPRGPGQVALYVLYPKATN